MIFSNTSYNDIIIPRLGEAALRSALQKALADNEAEWNTNREALIDFYESQQTDKPEYLEDFFNLNEDPLGEPDFPHNLILTQCNITRKIIDKKAKLYKKQPKRLIDNVEDDEYYNLLRAGGWNTTSKMIDRMTWLLGDACLIFYADADTKKLMFELPIYFRPIFKDGDMYDPVAVIYPAGWVQGKDGMVRAWKYWDAEKYMLFEQGTWNVLDNKPNEHGCLNAIFTHRNKPTRSFWTQDSQDLIDANRDVNVALTSINNAIRYQGFPNLAAIGIDPNEAKKIKLRWDKMIGIANTGEGQFSLQYLNPGVNWAGLYDTIKRRIEMVSMSWNVDVRWDMSGSIASGIALKILSVDDMDDKEEMKELYEEQIEQPLYSKLVTASDKIEWIKVPGGDFSLVWPPDDYYQTPQEQLAETKLKIEMNLTNPVDEMRKDNPNLTEEEARLQYVRNLKINKLLAKNTESPLQALLSMKDVEAGIKELEAEEPEEPEAEDEE